jgi:hypothetical protein
MKELPWSVFTSGTQEALDSVSDCAIGTQPHPLSKMLRLQTTLLLLWGLFTLQILVLYRASKPIEEYNDNLPSMNHNYTKAVNVSASAPLRDKKSQRKLLPPRNLTLIFSTKGEMGNYLNSISHALRIKHWIESKYPHLTVLLQAEHRDDYKWHGVSEAVTKCFPVLRKNIEFFQGGNWMKLPIVPANTTLSHQVRRTITRKEKRKYGSTEAYKLAHDRYLSRYHRSRYDIVSKHQEKWLKSRKFNATTALHFGYCGHCWDADDEWERPCWKASSPGSCWKRKMGVVLRMHEEQARRRSHKKGPQVLPLLAPEPPYPSSEPPLKYVSLPYLRADEWSFGTPFEGSYYDSVREWFAMDHDNPSCCPPSSMLPAPDEIVWHYRNFRGENEELLQRGFHELNPQQALKYIFEPVAANRSSANGNAPLKIAMVSRFPNDLNPFVEELKTSRYRFDVRVLENGTATSDFCFLRHTQSLLVGVHISSFLGWSAILGHPPTLVYIVNSTFSRDRAHRVNKTLLSLVGRSAWIQKYDRFSLTVVPDHS